MIRSLSYRKLQKKLMNVLKKEHNTTVQDNYSQEDIMGIVLFRNRQDDGSDIIESYNASLLDNEYLSRFISIA